MNRFELALSAICTIAVASCHSAAPVPASLTPVLTAQQSGVTVRFQAISVINEHVVWVSGTHGTWALTEDGGAHWRSAMVPGADSLEFRDVQGVDARSAYLMSSGTGSVSRIYKTTDGGANWALQFTTPEPKGFFDCLAFWDATHGVVVSDAVDGRLPIYRTTDGVQWTPVPTAGVPAALPNEGGFAASGTCVIARGATEGWFGTGAGERARILHTTDRGLTWSVSESPMVQGAATKGITSIAFQDALHGMIVGGDVNDAKLHSDNVAVTADGGKNWTLAGRPRMAGALFGAVYVPGLRGVAVAVGPAGADFTQDDGKSWQSLDTLSYWSAGFASANAGWLVGPGGRIVKVGMRGG
ncbi:MAG: oxidoreductase, partial [Gemmatimonadota bacterium]